jgi:uncharacterized membrane protein
MESSDQFNFNLFQPRNLHGKKNRNVILSMLVIWCVAVFGFQFLLRAIEKPTPEKALGEFEAEWPAIVAGNYAAPGSQLFLHSLLMVKGKLTVNPDDQLVIGKAISTLTFKMVPDTLREQILNSIAELKLDKAAIASLKDNDYLDMKTKIQKDSRVIAEMTEPYTGIKYGTLESAILVGSLSPAAAEALGGPEFSRLPEIMKLYLTHNQSKLTDSIVLGFPFHYFYTAVFLLILFVSLCIVYNILIEWRLKKEGIVE